MGEYKMAWYWKVLGVFAILGVLFIVGMSAWTYVYESEPADSKWDRQREIRRLNVEHYYDMQGSLDRAILNASESSNPGSDWNVRIVSGAARRYIIAKRALDGKSYANYVPYPSEEIQVIAERAAYLKRVHQLP